MILEICALALSGFVCYTLFSVSKYIKIKTDEVRVQISVYQIPKIDNTEQERILEQVQDETAETALRVIRDPFMAAAQGQQNEDDYYGWD